MIAAAHCIGAAAVFQLIRVGSPGSGERSSIPAGMQLRTRIFSNTAVTCAFTGSFWVARRSAICLGHAAAAVAGALDFRPMAPVSMLAMVAA